MTVRLLAVAALLAVAGVAHAGDAADATWRMSHDMWHRPAPATP